MADGQLRSAINQLKRVLSRGGGAGVADRQLLEDFVQRRDERAFEVLVWRHGAMVLSLCQRVLQDSHAAEDAFQATFLVFARKASSIGRGEAVGSWLYKVAGAGLGMKVLVWGQAHSAKRAVELGYGVADGKAALFERADVLSLHVRLRTDTTGIVGPEDLARMKPTALIVNTSRAELIQPGALLAAFRAGRPGYAAVDVYEQEPIMHGEHPFLSMPNVICTPHLGWAEWDNFELYYSEAFEQIAAFAKGEPLRLANPEVKPR